MQTDQNLPSTKETRKAQISNTPRKRTLKLGKHLARLLLIVLFSLGVFLSLFPWGQASIKTALLLPALISASEPAPLAQLGDQIRFTRSTMQTASGPIFLDTYEPAASAPLIPGKRAAIINVVGVGDNRDAVQLINLSRAFTHEGIVVVNVATPTLFKFEIATQDGNAVVQAFQMLSKRSDVDSHRIGIVGFSAGATLACAAAADPRIRDQIAFITLFGGYFDATSLLRTFGQRAITADGHTQRWQPVYVPTYVLANAFQNALSPAENTLFQKAFSPDGHTLNPDELQSLSPAALAAYHLLAGDEPAQVEQNMTALTPQMITLLNQLSPRSIIDKIHTPIYLLHDRSDQYIPYTQSREFAAALTDLHHTYEFAEFGIFEHVEVRTSNGLGILLKDGSQLFSIVNKMFTAAS